MARMNRDEDTSNNIVKLYCNMMNIPLVASPLWLNNNIAKTFLLMQIKNKSRTNTESSDRNIRRRNWFADNYRGDFILGKYSLSLA
jgi:hypothetical protein